MITVSNSGLVFSNKENRRGYAVLDDRVILPQAAVNKYGETETVNYALSNIALDIYERLDIFRSCSPIFSIVTGRMNYISGMEWRITQKKKVEDEIVYKIKFAKQIFDEFKGGEDPRHIGISVKAKQFIARYLPDLLPDMANFDKSLFRWSTKLRKDIGNRAAEIEAWLHKPSRNTTIENFLKILVFNTHVHGIAGVYKKKSEFSNRINELYTLPGGSVYPRAKIFVDDPDGFIQVIDNYKAQLFDTGEAAAISFAQFDTNDFCLPLDAIVNNISEILLFERRAADMSNGEKYPEKMVVFGQTVPFGDLGGNGESFQMPLPKDEQEKIQRTVNETRKDAILIVSGHGTPAVVDISRADTFNAQSDRIRMLREQIGNVFGASNAEMNLTGTDSTNGRESSQTQERKDREKGIYPHLKSIENMFNYDIIPNRYSEDWMFSFEMSLSEREQIEMWKNKLESGLFSVNEIRTMDIGIDAFNDKQFDIPKGATPPQPEGDSVAGADADGGGDIQNLLKTMGG
ncbi:MAG: hypothetical protein LBP19_05230 [Treponema sp.]|jgi:hypothetical protein|nr:hypothetical protein [Treponema sp.]